MSRQWTTPQRFQGDSSSSTFWNCASHVGAVRAACTDGPMRVDGEDYREGFVDDDDSVVEYQPNRRPVANARPLPPQQRMRNIVDGFLSPFINCVQPPLQACVAPTVDDWKPPVHSASARFFSPPASKSSVTSAEPHRSKSRCASILNDNPLYMAGHINGSLNASAATPPRHYLVKPPPLATLMVPNDNDILCGRGNNSNRHPGNIYFRDLITENKVQYSTQTKKEKMLLARQIVDLILYHTDPPGRFLGRDTCSGLWYDIGLPRSLEKTSQALREKSAASKAAEKANGSGSITIVASFDGCDSTSEGVEVTHRDPLDENEDSQTAPAAISVFCRSSTAKMTNQRSMPVTPPTVNVPEHLRTVYNSRRRQNPTKLADTDKTSRHAIRRDQSTALSAEFQQSYVSQHRHVAAPVPPNILPFYRPTPQQSYDYHQCHSNIDVCYGMQSQYPPPSPSQPIQSPPRWATQYPSYRHHPQSSHPSAALVTPSGRNDYQPEHTRTNYVPTSPTKHTPSVYPERFTTAPSFPLDVFKNPEYSYRKMSTATQKLPYEGILATDRTFDNRGPDGSLSPTREQQPKRRRTGEELVEGSENCLLDTSNESIVELNTSKESNDGDINGIVGAQQASGLTKAIATQLTLEDRVIRSPSELTQSIVGGRRRRSQLLPQSLPRPSKLSSALDLSADSMDGLAALSTAAFLRLDESF